MFDKFQHCCYVSLCVVPPNLANISKIPRESARRHRIVSNPKNSLHSTYSFVNQTRMKNFSIYKIRPVIALLGLMVILSPLSYTSKTHASGTITGRVFQDFNDNGIYDSSGAAPNYALDAGVGNVTVTVYDASGTARGTATSAATTGLYSIAATGTGPYRVEFTTLPSGYYSSAHSTDSAANRSTTTAGSTVQFVPDGITADVNLAINRPADYCQNNPLICVPQHIQGNVDGGALETFPNSYSGDLDGNINSTSVTSAPSRTTTTLAPTDIAQNNSVGALFGVAWDRYKNILYASAFIKRSAKLGSLSGESTGAIYVKSNPSSNTPTPTVFADLNNIFGANTAGSNPHLAGSTTWTDDSSTNASVGKRGLGDLKLSQDGSKLYVVNLFDRKLYVIPTSGTLDSTTVTRFDIPTDNLMTNGGTCPTADVRPFALGRDAADQIYVGAVCSAESVTTNAATYLHAFVWRFSGSTFTLVANTTLNYTRKLFIGSTTLYNNYPWVAGDNPTRPELWLIGIEFDQDGSMILGFRDKNGDESQGSADRGYGDLLRATPNGSTFTVENNGNSGTVTNHANTFGLGGGEYYLNYNADNRNEGSQGGLLQIPGFPYVQTTAYDAVSANSAGNYMSNFYTGGLQRYNNASGNYVGAYDVYLNATTDTFRKANGIGDIEALCDKAPVEIGNRVWRDANNDGIQNPGETGISGVTVRLYDSAGTSIASAITDANGEYYFSSASGTSSGNTIYGLNLLPNTNYSIRLDNQTNFNSGNPLAGLSLTASNVSSQAGFADGSDSDAVNVSNPVGSPTSGVFPVISVTTGSSGQNNHTYDFGFRLGVTAASISVKGRVLDNRWNGIEGAQVTLISQDGTALTTLSDRSGFFTFEQVAGQTAIVTVAAKGRTFAEAHQFVGLTEDVEGLYFIANGPPRWIRPGIRGSF